MNKAWVVAVLLAGMAMGADPAHAIFSFDPPPYSGLLDYNGDGSVDLLDLDILGSQFGECGPGLVADANGDGCVDLLDMDLLGAGFGGTAPANSPAAGIVSNSFPPINLSCDFNGDEQCDLLDLDILGSQFGECGPGLVADANDDGCVDLLDLEILGAGVGGSNGGGVFSVPEPASVMLLIFGMTALVQRRRG